ncbi:MAG TPA: DUF2071 domain-containing protein, partial [Bryobacteraceae bacterium]|nr:DUF2071 domain-containing protein [Bryobacteraceae bacterium]
MSTTPQLSFNAGTDLAAPSIPFPIMHQRWCNLTFLHWRFPQSVVASLVPAPLEVETFDGSAWVGVTPFHLRGLRPPFVPELPWLSSFPETNCRTYVRGPDGQSGVWFFSLDAARLAAVVGARLGFGLPYFWSRMRVERTAGLMRYRSDRRWSRTAAFTRIAIQPGDPIVPGELELFLTARYRLYSFIAGRLTYTSVEHAPWPLYSAHIVRLEQTLVKAAGLPQPQHAPIAHFSPGVAVRV